MQSRVHQQVPGFVIFDMFLHGLEPAGTISTHALQTEMVGSFDTDTVGTADLSVDGRVILANKGSL